MESRVRALEITMAANTQKLFDIKEQLAILQHRFDKQDKVLTRIDKAVSRLALMVPALGGAAFIIGLLFGVRL